MSKLQGRLSRRKQQRVEPASPREAQSATNVQIDERVNEPPQDEVVEAAQEDDGADDSPAVSGSKSDVIAQLRRRMKKIESSTVRAFGAKNASHPEGTPLSTASSIPRSASSPRSASPINSSALVNNGETIIADDDSETFAVDTELCDLPGQIRNTSQGEVWLNRREYPEYVMGTEPINRYLQTGPALAAFAKDDRLASLSPDGALFIDTETTGLSGGAGTLPFLVGVGFFEQGVFVVEQYFCREPSEEPAQLEALSQRMQSAKYLVSFNGKSFDMPLINTRFIINKVKNPGYNLPHLDLLHVSRRIFKRRLSDRSLQNLEKVILGFVREGDIPGAEIPAAYRDFLFGAGTDRIEAILEHNLLDIVALAALGGVLDKIYSDPQAVAHAADSLGLAKEAFGAGQKEIGNGHLDAADAFGSADDKRIALHMKAKEALRRKAWSEAVDVYLRVLDVDEDDVDAHLQLAKLYEHRKKNYDKAIYHAKQIAALEGEDGAAYRVARIEKKKEKHAKRKW